MKNYHSYSDLIRNNARWAQAKLEQDGLYFKRLAEYQAPPFLFIGCSDSRMPIDTFTQTEPGELFIHRNIANQIYPTDMNFLSVLEYAVEVLRVKHIIVCGHYSCGGVEAAYDDSASGLTENWITRIKDLIREHRGELEAIPDRDSRLNRLSEINVIAQVKNIFMVSAIARLIEGNGYNPTIHGWVLDLKRGLIKDLELPIEAWKKEGIIPMNYTVPSEGQSQPVGETK
jgi:carbonic anhydrase